MNGSSLNRLHNKKRKDELQKLFEKPPQIQGKVGETIGQYREYESTITDLRETIVNQQRHRKEISDAHAKCKYGLHMLSPRSKGKIRDKCTAFYRCLGQQGTFATLTFIQQTDDKTAITILNKFLTALRDDYKKLKYIWVAERQENSNIHFHLIINQRLPVRRYNALWVVQQYNAGLSFDTVTSEEIRARNDAGTIHEILNPFDIKKIKSIYGLNYYLTKYITKNKSIGFDCSAWHCSRNVSRLFTKTVATLSCLRAASSFNNARVDKSTGEIIHAKNVRGNFYNLYYIENRPYFLREMSEVEQVNKWILGGMLPDKIPECDEAEIIKFYNN